METVADGRSFRFKWKYYYLYYVVMMSSTNATMRPVHKMISASHFVLYVISILASRTTAQRIYLFDLPRWYSEPETNPEYVIVLHLF